MNPILLHEHNEFPDLIRIVADKQLIDPVIVEKDYWMMHGLWGLQQQGFKFSLKGGTSLSKGHKIINRFSEDLDMLIEPLAEGGITVNQTSLKDNAVKSRKDFYDWLKDNLKIPGIIAVERDTEFDDERYYRSGGIRLQYQTYTGSLEGVKDGILLEAGFSKVAPNQPITISSWLYDFAKANANIDLIDNRAVDVPCYNPGYTLVEKIQTIIRNFRQEAAGGKKLKNYMRQYYDLYSLLGIAQVQAFIGTPEYLQHKADWIKGADAEIPVNTNPAFLLTEELMNDFEGRYKATTALYFRGQPPFTEIIARIQQYLPKL